MLERELRALGAAAKEHARATRCLLVLTHDEVPARMAAGTEVLPVYQRLLNGAAP